MIINDTVNKARLYWVANTFSGGIRNPRVGAAFPTLLKQADAARGLSAECETTIKCFLSRPPITDGELECV